MNGRTHGAGSNHDFLEERHFSLFDEFLLTVPRSDVVASSRTNPARGPSRVPSYDATGPRPPAIVSWPTFLSMEK